MKVKDLIKELKKANPETEVVVNGKAIISGGELPGYYDGSYSKAILNEQGIPIGILNTRKGSKFKLITIDIEDAIFDNPNFTIDWDENDYYFSDRYKKLSRLKHEALRWEARRLDMKYRVLDEWFPLTKYESVENPYKIYLPKHWEDENTEYENHN